MIKKGVKQLCAEAEAVIETMSVAQVMAVKDDPNVELIDIRDVRELWRDGAIPGAWHVPRGMLEFWVDPDSEYHRDVFSSGKRFVFYCAKGHRSALATQAVKSMGLDPVCHIGGGFEAWTQAGLPVEAVEKK